MKYLSLCLAVSVVAGCSSVTKYTDVTNLVNYSNNKSVKVLEVPSDLDVPKYDKTYLTAVSDTAKQGDNVITDAVPLVDSSLAGLSGGQVRIITRGNEQALQIDDNEMLWKKTLAALKAMGVTVSKSDEATGLISGRDRSLVSDPGSPIGAFLNRSMGKLNKGAQYQVSVISEDEFGLIIFRNGAGKPLSAKEAKMVLNRLYKGYVAS